MILKAESQKNQKRSESENRELEKSKNFIGLKKQKTNESGARG